MPPHFYFMIFSTRDALSSHVLFEDAQDHISIFLEPADTTKLAILVRNLIISSTSLYTIRFETSMLVNSHQGAFPLSKKKFI